ncbi:MAG: hypothetical protein ABIJ26_06300 [Candidatus Margulisiibacteriota bacterium]|nr:hypothetical protein [Candidatus Margulisiibacteriota bacterium]
MAAQKRKALVSIKAKSAVSLDKKTVSELKRAGVNVKVLPQKVVNPKLGPSSWWAE